MEKRVTEVLPAILRRPGERWLNAGLLESKAKKKNMRRKVVLDDDCCIGGGSCAELCPDVFEMHEKAKKAHVILPGGGSEECIEEAIATRPGGAHFPERLIGRRRQT